MQEANGLEELVRQLFAFLRQAGGDSGIFEARENMIDICRTRNQTMKGSPHDWQ